MPPALKVTAEKRELGKLISGDDSKREWYMEEREAVREALVKCYNHVLFVQVDVFEAVNVHAQTEEAGGKPSPPALRGPAGSPAAYGQQVWQHRSDSKYEPCRTEQYEDGCPRPKPFPGGADSEIAAEKDA